MPIHEWTRVRANRFHHFHPDWTVEIARALNRGLRFLRSGIHLLILLDVFPPSKRDPQGVHKLIWDRIHEEPYELPPGKPFTPGFLLGGRSDHGLRRKRRPG